ncbi:M48 family metallopeptidase [Oribacterium sp. C9]|uniref:M48 family metallopeptidase n=1 Tax=Oribacterium sp. C9 TaxID=1943579 RepID=UPI001980993B|nr:M48 family metallopeptidase [Oribacterium sp. C9]
MQIEIQRCNRKSIVISVNSKAEVVIKAPYRTTDTEIQEVLKKRAAWIKEHVDKVMKERERAESLEPISSEELQKLGDKAVEFIPKRVEYFAEKVGVSYGRITIRNQKTRWGSCSSKGNLNFNCLLMLTPPDIIDYVIVHELCHRKVMDHSIKFWAEVEKVLPDYKKRRKWLNDNGGVIIGRME